MVVIDVFSGVPPNHHRNPKSRSYWNLAIPCGWVYIHNTMTLYTGSLIVVGVARIGGSSNYSNPAAFDVALVHVYSSEPFHRASCLQVDYSIASAFMCKYYSGGVCLFVCFFRYVKLPLGNMGIYDPTDIRNRGMLTYFQKEAFVKIAYNLIIFFISLYG